MDNAFLNTDIIPSQVLAGANLGNLAIHGTYTTENQQIFASCPLTELNVLNTSSLPLSGRIKLGMFYAAGGGTHPGNGKINVIIDSSITVIESEAFLQFGSNGTKMEWFEVQSTTPPSITQRSTGWRAFTNTGTVPIYVPDSAVAAYKAASGWSDYADRIFAVSTRN
jgi:hypothetical protein